MRLSPTAERGSTCVSDRKNNILNEYTVRNSISITLFILVGTVLGAPADLLSGAEEDGRKVITFFKEIEKPAGEVFISSDPNGAIKTVENIGNIFGAPEDLVGSGRPYGADFGLRERLVAGPKSPETPPYRPPVTGHGA